MTEKQKTELEAATQIAHEHGHKVRTARANKTGETVYTVKSYSRKNLFHVLYIAKGRIVCDCFTCQQKRIICSHAAAVREFLIEQRAALESIERAEHKEAAQPASAEQSIYCEECGRFKSHCDAAGHANPPAPWSRMGQAGEDESAGDIPEQTLKAAAQVKSEYDKHFGPGMSKSVEEIAHNMLEDERREAERLASLPRELVGAQVSEEAKLEALERPICSNCGQVINEGTVHSPSQFTGKCAVATEGVLTIFCDDPDCWAVVTKPGYCAECEAEREAFDREIQLVDQMAELEHDDAMTLLDRETPDDEWEEEEAEPALTTGQRAERAIVATNSKPFSVYRS